MINSSPGRFSLHQISRWQLLLGTLIILFSVIIGVIIPRTHLAPYIFLAGVGLVFAVLFVVVTGAVSERIYRVALFWAIALGILLPKLAFLIPALPLGGQIGLEDTFVVLLAISVLFRDRVLPSKAMFLVFFFLLLSGLLSTFWSSAIINRPLAYQDFFGLYNIIRWWALWLLAFKVGRSQPDKAFRLLVIVLILTFLIEFALSIAHILRWSVAVDIVLRYFRRGSFYGLRQASGTFPNGNYLGTFTAILIVSFFSIGRYTKSPLSRIVFWSLAGLASVLLLLSESKFSILIIVLVFPLVYVVNYDSFHKPARSAINLLVILVVTSCIFFAWQSFANTELSLQNSELVETLSILSEGGGEDSGLQRRLDDWKRAIDDWSESPIFGQGPSEADELLKFHGDWVELLRNYGLLGVASYLAALIIPFFYSLQLATKTRNRRDQVLGTMAMAAIISIAVAAIAYESLTNVQMATVLWPIAGVASGRLAYINATADQKS